MQLKDIGDTTLWIGPLVDVSTGQPVAVAVPWSSVYVNGAPLSAGSGSSYACVTNAQGVGQITVLPMTAGRFRVDVQVTGCLPWFDPCVQVGLVETIGAIRNPAGSGATAVTITIKNTAGKLVQGCGVSVYRDQACTFQVPDTGTQFTDQFGKVLFNLSSGTYWVKKVHPGTRFQVNPQQITVA